MERFFKCKVCLNDFDSKDRIPYHLHPCSHIACATCVKQMKESGNLCKFDHESPVEIQQYVVQAQMMYEMKFNFGIIIHCSKHPTKVAEFFQTDKKIFICSHCAILEEDRLKLISQDEENLLKQADLLYDYACQLEKKVEQFKKLGKTMRSGTISYPGDQIFDQVSEALKCFGNCGIEIDEKAFELYKVPKQQIIQKTVDIQTMIDTMCQDIQTLNNQIDVSLQVEEPLKSYDFWLKNSLLCNNFAINLDKWLDQKYELVCLLFRASTDGFQAKTFHEKCDNKGPTLTIVQSTKNFVFGGFLSKSWTSKSGQIEDEEAFMFSLTYQTKHVIKGSQTKYAAYDNPNTFSQFGNDGKEFFLTNLCNANQNSNSNIGQTYEPPNGINYGSDQAKSYLAGEHKFTVKEIEVFQLRAK